MHKYRGKGINIVFGDPLPPTPAPFKPAPKNIVKFAIEIKEFLTSDPAHTYKSAASKFNITRARISQLMKILNTPPPDLIIQLKNCENNEILPKFSGKSLLKIAKIGSFKERQTHINRLTCINR
jgi:hypothetical protein